MSKLTYPFFPCHSRASLEADCLLFRPVPLPFSTDQWKRSLRSLSDAKSQYCFEQKIPLVETKETATTEDRVCLASVLIWDGTQKGSEMLLMICQAVQFCGRGIDLANSKLSDVYVDKNETPFTKFDHLGQMICRSKTSTFKKHSVFPQRDSEDFMLCYYFCLPYLLLMMDESIIETNTLFPSFAAKVYQKKKQSSDDEELFSGKDDKKVLSRVSDLFNQLMDWGYEMIYDLYGDMGKFNISCNMFHFVL